MSKDPVTTRAVSKPPELAISHEQYARLLFHFERVGIKEPDLRLLYAGRVAKRQVWTLVTLTKREARDVIDALLTEPSL